MYKITTIKSQLELFEKSLPFSGKLNSNNRWIKLCELVDWERFEQIYSKLFSPIGRPGISSRLAIGTLIIKHIMCVSDEESVQTLCENPYLQFFVGFMQYSYTAALDSSSLTHVRKRLGESNFSFLEGIVADHLRSLNLLRPGGTKHDATVYPSDITYPTDVSLLNKVRRYLVNQIKYYGKQVGLKFRTYCHVAQKEFVSFNKKRKKTFKEIRKVKKAMLQYVRRNLKQMRNLSEVVHSKGIILSEKTKRLLKVSEQIYEQQKLLYCKRLTRIANRIVSFHKPYIRPIVRGKAGKPTEFGAKVGLMQVDKYIFPTRISFDNFNEGEILLSDLEIYKSLFGKAPVDVTTDQIYGTRSNRKVLGLNEIRFAVKPLGRSPNSSLSSKKESRWRKNKQRKRNQIEGLIGHSKKDFLLDRILAKLPETEEIWIRLGLMSMNLAMALKRY